MEGFIYKYTSPVGKNYIGQTTDEVRRRRDFLCINKVYAGPKINRARKKYGPENFKYSVLVRVESDNVEELHNYLNTLERGFIRMYDTIKNGYNSCDGGSKNVSGFHHSDETKNKISESHKGKHYLKGIPKSDEHKRKISESHKGRKRVYDEDGIHFHYIKIIDN